MLIHNLLILISINNIFFSMSTGSCMLGTVIVIFFHLFIPNLMLFIDSVCLYHIAVHREK